MILFGALHLKTSAFIHGIENCIIPVLSRNYDGPTNQPTSKQQTNQQNKMMIPRRSNFQYHTWWVVVFPRDAEGAPGPPYSCSGFFSPNTGFKVCTSSVLKMRWGESLLQVWHEQLKGIYLTLTCFFCFQASTVSFIQQPVFKYNYIRLSMTTQSLKEHLDVGPV